MADQYDHSTVEDWHTVEDGEKLYIKTWKPTTQAKARLVFLHGFSDHCNLFDPLFPYLASRGIEVFGVDQRGWGRSVKSPKQRGLTGPTPRVLDDIASILTRFITPSGPVDNTPLFLMGHSMGGAETIHFACSPQYTHLHKHIRGYMLASPWIKLHPATAPWRITVWAGRIAARLAPHAQLYNPVAADHLSRDPAVLKMFKADPLAHDYGTFEGFAGMLDRATDIEEGRCVLYDSEEKGFEQGAKAFWAGHGTDDSICDFAGTRDWMERDCRVKDKELRAYEGWKHRTNDQEGEKKEIFRREVADWILARV